MGTTCSLDKGVAVTTALVVIDVQVGVVEDAASVDQVITSINGLLDSARQANAPVIFVQHNDDGLMRHSAQWVIDPRLDYRADDTLVEKSYPDSFADTTLAQELSSRDVTRLVICGAQSNWCVNATARAALIHGYDVILAADAHTTGSVPLDSGDMSAEQVIEFITDHFRWLRYPGRDVGAAASADISFR
jgi:nicotinamidase-related amidase